MFSEETKEIVVERLDLIKQLIEARAHFRGYHRAIDIEQYITHPYTHYSALRVYLALTCFDILGQPTEWVDFATWLKAGKKKEEREAVFAKHSSKKITEQIVAVHEDYNKIYGVKNSFYRFLREIMSFDNRCKLINSIRVTTSRSPAQVNASTIDFSTHQKEKFLFDIRNSFTHKGISHGNPLPGTFPMIDEGRRYDPVTKKQMWLWLEIHREKKGNEYIYYNVLDWPFILIDIVEDTLNIKS